MNHSFLSFRLWGPALVFQSAQATLSRQDSWEGKQPFPRTAELHVLAPAVCEGLHPADPSGFSEASFKAAEAEGAATFKNFLGS